MSSSLAAAFSARQRAALETLLADLERIFGTRLRSVVAYDFDYASISSGEAALRTLVLVEGLAAGDLHHLAPLARGWHRIGVAVPNRARG